MPVDRATLRRPGRVPSRRPPRPVDTVARIVELRDEGLSFKKIGKTLGIAAWAVSRSSAVSRREADDEVGHGN